MTLFSIITPTLNAGRTLREAIESVEASRAGGGFQVEHLIVDGGSTDSTLAIARSFPELLVSSEPDAGLYDAMNRGARKATGQFLVFLQADDWLLPGGLHEVAKMSSANPGTEIFHCGAEAIREETGLGGECGSLVWRKCGSAEQALNIPQIALGEPMLNARIFSRKLFMESGGFSLDYQLASDRDFLLRLCTRKIKDVSLPLLLYRYRWHSASLTMSEGNPLSQRLTLENLAIAENFPASNLTTEEMRALSRWHRAQSVQLAMMEIEACNFHGFLRAMRRGSARSKGWILSFLCQFARSLAGFLARGCKTKSSVNRTASAVNTH